jgi:hypothetical protein
LLASVLAIVLASLATSGADRAVGATAIVGGMVVVGGVILGAAAGGRQPTPRQREVAWELEAIGLAVVAVAWLLGPGLT